MILCIATGLRSKGGNPVLNRKFVRSISKSSIRPTISYHIMPCPALSRAALERAGRKYEVEQMEE